MHGALPVAARVAAREAASGGRHQAACCHQPGCHAAETVSHALVECSVARRVWEWAGGLWAAVSGRPPPPVSVAVCLAAEEAAFSPGRPREGVTRLWHVLRLAVIYYLWACRCSGREQGRGVPALAVAARVVYHLRARIREDAVRAFGCPRDYAVLGAGWLPARQRFTPTDFADMWAYGGVLCRATSLDDLTTSLTLVHPVPPPSRAA